MKVFKQSRNSNEELKEVHIILKYIGVKIITYKNDNLYKNVKTPKNLDKWIYKQIGHYKKSSNNIAKDVITFISKYSQKPFNFYLDKNLPLTDYAKRQIKRLEYFKVDKDIMINKLLEYFYKAPVTTKSFTVYSGIGRDDYNDNIKGKNKWISKRLRSATFDKYHALQYSHYRGEQSEKENLPYVLLQFDVGIDIFCIYTKHENQIIFPPNTEFKIKGKIFSESKYKDIESDEYSEEELIVESIVLEPIINKEKLYKYYKAKYISKLK